MDSALVSLILLMNIQGFLTLEQLHVNCEQKNICALMETNVTLTCSYSNINITTVFWFSQKQRNNWRENDEPEDLTLDSDYSGRVNQRITKKQSQLTISDVRETDSGEYQLMFIMKDDVKHLSSITVNLTVTVLQVRKHQESKKSKNQNLKLTCDTSCTLTSKPQRFYWRKDGQFVKKSDSQSFSVSLKENAAYSCLITPDHNIPSAPVCLSNSNCWNVIYTSTRVCALVGSTVDIHSTYSHPTEYTVVKTYWHYIHPGGFRDLREEQQFAGRVDYVRNTLRIKDVKMSDSGEYQFRIITKKEKNYSGSPGVILTVTDTRVKSSTNPVSEGVKVILSCLTKCTLDNNITFSWYKNGRPVTDGFKLFNKLYLDSISKEEIQHYSCAVGDDHNKDQDVNPEKSMSTSVILVILFVLLILAVIGFLMCSFLKWKKFYSSQNAKETVQPDLNALDNASPPSRESDCTSQIEQQNVHYSSINFKQSHKTTSSSPNVIYSSIGDVYYATVKTK